MQEATAQLGSPTIRPFITRHWLTSPKNHSTSTYKNPATRALASADLVFINGALSTPSPLVLNPILPRHLAPPEALGQPVTAPPREEGSVSATLDQLSNQTDALMTIPEGKVAATIEAYIGVATKAGSPHSPPRNPRSMLGGGNKEGRIRWPTPYSAPKKSLPFSSRVGASAATTMASSERRKASDSGSRSEVAKDSAKLYPFSTASFNDDLGKHSIKTTCSAPDIMAIKTCEDMFVPLTETSEIIAAATVQTQSPQKLSDPSTPLPPPPSSPLPPPPSPPPPPPPPPSPPQPSPPARARSDNPPSNPLKEGGGETPTRSPDALPLSSPPNQRKALGSAPGESDAIHDRNQRAIAEDLPRTKATKPDANFFNSSDRNKPTFNPSQQNQNLWDLFGSRDAVKIYSALSCGLACGALAAISVPAAPVVAGIAGIAAGAIVGYAIAESISKHKEKTIQK